MTQKRIKQLVIGGAVLAAGAPRLTRVRSGSVGPMQHVGDGEIHDPDLTDHQQYVRHHQRLASQA